MSPAILRLCCGLSGLAIARLLNRDQIGQKRIGASNAEIEIRHVWMADMDVFAEIFGQRVRGIISQHLAQGRGIAAWAFTALADRMTAGALRLSYCASAGDEISAGRARVR